VEEEQPQEAEVILGICIGFILGSVFTICLISMTGMP
jgi:hypothetical protein